MAEDLMYITVGRVLREKKWYLCSSGWMKGDFQDHHFRVQYLNSL